MRRAMRHAHLLGAQDPLMHRLVPALVTEMGEAYPELGRAQAFIEDTLKQEEIRFRTTLGRGMGLLDEATKDLTEGGIISGKTAFTLYDTYGFPLDLTQDEARRRGLSVDNDGFEAEMSEQRQRGKANWKGSGQTANAGEWLALRDRLGQTVFTGYDAALCWMCKNTLAATCMPTRSKSKPAPCPSAPACNCAPRPKSA